MTYRWGPYKMFVSNSASLLLYQLVMNKDKAFKKGFLKGHIIQQLYYSAVF